MISRRESSAAAMLALWISWHYPGVAVPDEVEATVTEHGCAATIVSAEYADPFGLLGAYATAITPAQGPA